MSKFTPGPWELSRQCSTLIMSGNRSIASAGVSTSNVDTDLVHLENEANATLISAAPDMFAAIDAADTAFAVLNVQDMDDFPQARACIREAWPLVQSARAKARPDSGYADAVAESQQNEIARLDGVIAELRVALGCALNWIDAVPSDAAASFPAMPGFDRDWVDGLLSGGYHDEA